MHAWSHKLLTHAQAGAHTARLSISSLPSVLHAWAIMSFSICDWLAIRFFRGRLPFLSQVDWFLPKAIRPKVCPNIQPIIGEKRWDSYLSQSTFEQRACANVIADTEVNTESRQSVSSLNAIFKTCFGSTFYILFSGALWVSKVYCNIFTVIEWVVTIIFRLICSYL